MTPLILIAIYLLSAYGFWKYVQVAHSVNGIYEQMVDDNTTLAIIMVFIPVLNTMMSVVGWICFYPKKPDHEKREMHFVKFFKIKR
jgi:hypothetical protein